LSLLGFEPDRAYTQPDRFTGRYRFFDDGWTGVLRLEHAGDSDLHGEFASDRFKRKYEVTGAVDPEIHYRVVVTIHDYNDLDKQEYRGDLFTRSGKAIAGSSDWQGRPFGFFAVRTVRLALPVYRAGTVVPSDFTGSYSLNVDGIRGTLRLEAGAANRLSGSALFGAVQDPLPVRAETGTEVPYQLRIRIGSGRDPLLLNGYMFTRPKSAVAGTATWRGLPMGFFMVRFE
jgi:hypothetical protein